MSVFNKTYGSRIEILSALNLAKSGIATLWEYQASLAELTVRISFSGNASNLHIIFNGCTRIEAPTSWDNPELTLEQVTSSHARVKDDRARVLVECGSVRAFQNVEPLFEVADTTITNKTFDEDR